MIVVSDTSPLTALLFVSEADILPKLLGDVIIPEAVRDELLRYHASLPAWLRAKAVKDTAGAVRLKSVGE
jgi:predicted nucleic acid-binding protein